MAGGSKSVGRLLRDALFRKAVVIELVGELQGGSLTTSQL